MGEDLVLKINNYSLEEGEPSVYDRGETRGVYVPPAGVTTSRRLQKAGRDYDHQSHCQVCWESTGELIRCGGCPLAFHAKCIGLAPSELSFVGRNRMDILVEVARPSFEQLSPDYGLMTRSVPDCRVLSVTARASSSSHDPSEADFVTRSFAPWVSRYRRRRRPS